MKKNVILVAAVLFILNVFEASAQEKLSGKMQAAFDACWAMRTAISTGNTTGLRSANDAFRACGAKDFASLWLLDSNVLSLDGHFVWDEEFVDSLIAGRDVRKFAQRYAERCIVRGSSGTGEIFTKTCAVKGKGSTKFAFAARGHQELAVITEPGGKITLRIHDKKTGIWYNDTEDVKRGKESRTKVFNLPTDKRTTLEVEVINCGKEDISCIIISN